MQAYPLNNKDYPRDPRQNADGGVAQHWGRNNDQGGTTGRDFAARSGEEPIHYKAINYKNIPVQPDVIAGIVSMDVESSRCFYDLDRFISSDQGVATLVLRAVNSPFYGRGKSVSNIPMAISILGFNVIRSLALLAFSRTLFSRSRNPLFHQHIWEHSILTALGAQTIYQVLGGVTEIEEVFIAGLMHDIGKLMMYNHDSRRYLKVLDGVLADGAPSIATEQQIFGCDHCQVGQEAVIKWKLPKHFVEYAGVDLTMPASLNGNLPQLSLALANCVVLDRGIGAREEPDPDVRKMHLLGFGISEEQATSWSDENFVPALTENETYRLFAKL